MYFLKITRGEAGIAMLRGEFKSMLLIQDVKPALVPRAITVDTCSSERPDLHFMMSEFVDMDHTTLVPRDAFCAEIADLHVKSMGKSPGCQYGFDVTTHNGNAPLFNDYQNHWSDFYKRSLQQMKDLDTQISGVDVALDEIWAPLVDKVIPRLLGAVEKHIKPCLVHGDLWHGNTGISKSTGKAVIFDSGACWAHNEYELGNWYAESSLFRHPYFESYHSLVPKSEPVDEWEDRIRLYSM